MKLKKDLNLIGVFSVASGAMISSGLFILPGIAHKYAGPGVIISYLLAGILALIGMLSIAELATAMPKAGGDYFFITRSMGPGVGTIAGLLSWFSLSLKSAFALVGMAAFTHLIVNINIHIIAIILCIIFIFINILGIKEAGKVQIFLVTGLLVLLLFYIVRGIPSVQVKFFEPFAPYGIKAIISTAGFVFVSYGGLVKVVSVAEEVKNPGKTIPLGMMLSLFVVSSFYALVIFITVGVLGAGKLDNSLTPISDGAGVFLGFWGKIVLAVAAILAFISTANAGIMAASRYPFAISRDKLLPGIFGKISPRFKTPYFSILMTGIFIILSLFLRLDILVEAASTVIILTYMLSSLSVIIMRESKILNYKPIFHSPLYPYLQIIGIIGFAFLILEMGKLSLLITFLLILAGGLLYWFYGRVRTKQEYALLHFIEKVIDKKLTTYSLERELKEIIKERDTIVEDRFDKMIKKSIILNINKHISLEDFFKIASEKISPEIGIEPSTLFDLLIQREKESSTVLNPNLAIPHIIIEGEKKFCGLLARCKKGIFFSKSYPGVTTVFLLVGTRDERNFHLRALSAIAQIVQDKSFEKDWIQAESENALRDVILLSERKRIKY